MDELTIKNKELQKLRVTEFSNYSYFSRLKTFHIRGSLVFCRLYGRHVHLNVKRIP